MYTFKLRLINIFIVFLIISISSCEDVNDDLVIENDIEVETTDSSTELTAMIDGVKFESNRGRVEIAPDAPFDENVTQDLFIQLFSKFDPVDKCDIAFRAHDQISFRPPYEVGKYELFEEDDTYFNLAVVFWDHGNNEPYNSYDGYIEIISISEEKITGKVDATYNSDNWVRGSFELVFCTE